MNTEELKQIALAAAKNIKTEQDLAEFQQMLTKVTVEAALKRGTRRSPGLRAPREVRWLQPS
ncbi:MAG: hypothetical protein ACI9LO_001520 [Planctomycetota bacterium]|jgi:hypothetical protein